MNDKRKINADDGPSAYERLQAIGQRSSAMKADGFDEGHEALIRFLDDLRDHMGWPAPGAGAAAVASAQLWRIKPINDSRGFGKTTYDLNFPYVKHGGVRGFEHACTLEVTHPGAPVRVSIEFKAMARGAKGPGQWDIVMNGKDAAILSLSDYDPPHDALEEAAKHIGAALYYATWNGYG